MHPSSQSATCDVSPRIFRDDAGTERRLRVVTHEAWVGGRAYAMPLDAAAPALRHLDRQGLLNGGAYFLTGPKLTNGGMPVYVGRSFAMAQRLNGHMSAPAALPEFLANGAHATWFDRLVYVADHTDPFWGSCVDWVESHLITYFGSLTSVNLVNRRQNRIGDVGRNVPAEALPFATHAVERILEMLPAFGVKPNADWAHKTFVERMRTKANHLLIQKTCCVLPEDLFQPDAA